MKRVLDFLKSSPLLLISALMNLRNDVLNNQTEKQNKKGRRRVRSNKTV